MNIEEIKGLPKVGQGMESTVYRLDREQVCKLYHRPRFENQEKLRRFYDSLGRDTLPFALPQILENQQIQGRTLTVEKSIPGTSYIQEMPGWSQEVGRKRTAQYVAALLALRGVPCTRPDGRIWKDFLHTALYQSFHKNRPYLPEFIEEALMDAIAKRLAAVDAVPPTLLHGDYCPENVLLDNGSVTGVIDFAFTGLMGDYRYDLATAWRFYDMYDQCPQPYKQWFYAEMTAQAGLSEKDLFAVETYILFYSVYSAGFYSQTLSDGHSAWCFENLKRGKFFP